MKTLKGINLIIILIVGTACSMADYKPESISKYQAGEIETVLLGTILQLESVVIEGNRDLGAAAGAAVGSATVVLWQRRQAGADAAGQRASVRFGRGGKPAQRQLRLSSLCERHTRAAGAERYRRARACAGVGRGRGAATAAPQPRRLPRACDGRSAPLPRRR